MDSILNREDREALAARLRLLSPDHKPLWGKLTASKMLCHLADQVAVALGDIPAKSVGNCFSHKITKLFVVYLRMPTPKGRVMTVPEMLTTEPSLWRSDMDRLLNLITRLADTEAVSPHPAFGALTHHQWGSVTARHIDHHLRQFGV